MLKRLSGESYWQVVTRKPHRKLMWSLAAAAAAGMLPRANAAPLTWDASGTATSSPVDGSGAWSTSAANWNDGVSDSVWTNGANDAVFGNGGTAGTVTLGGNITAGNITFNSLTGVGNAYTIAGGGNTLTLGGGITANNSATISANLSSTAALNVSVGNSSTLLLSGGLSNTSGGLFKTGSGNLTLSASSNSVNGVQVNGGTLDVTGTLNSTGGGNDFYIGNVGSPGSGTLVIDTNAALSITGSYGDNVVFGRNGGSATVIQNAGSTFNFDPSNESYLYIDASNSSSTNSVYTLNGGTLNMNSKELVVGFGFGNGTLNVNSGASITNVGQLILASTYTGGSSDNGTVNQNGGSVAINSTGSLTIGAGSGLTGVYNLNGGTLTTPFVSTTGGTSKFNFNGGTLIANAGNSSFMTGLTSATVGAASAINNGGFAITIGQPLLHLSTLGATPDGGLTFQGGGITTLTGASTYVGNTTIAGGTLQVGNGTAGSLNGATGTALTFTGTGTFNVNEAGGANQGMGALSASVGDDTVQSTVASGNTTLSFASVNPRAVGAAVNFVTSGGTTNNIVLGGVPAGFIDQGTFFGGSNYAWNDAGGFVRGINYTSDAGGNTTSGGAALPTNDYTGSGTLLYAQTTGNITAQGNQTLSTLNLVNTGDAAQAFTLGSGQTLTTNGILRSGNGGTASTTTISGGTGIQAASNAELVIRTDQANDLLTISTPILSNVSNALTKSGIGTLVLSANASNFTGNVTVDAGNLTVTDTAAGLLNPASGALGNPQTAGRTITVNTGATLNFNANDILGNANSTPQVQLALNGGTASGNGIITTLGNLTLNGGTLVSNGGDTGFGSVDAWNLGSTVTVGGSAASFFNVASSPANSANAVSLNSGEAGGTGLTTFNIGAGSSLTVSTVLTNATFNGAAGSIDLTGGGSMVLAKANTFTGNVTVDAGNLTITGSAGGTNPTSGGLGNPQTAGRTITVNTGATLNFNANDILGNANSTPQVQLALNGGTASSNGIITTLGNLTLNGGTLVANGGYTGSGSVDAWNLGSTVTVGGSAASFFNVASFALNSANAVSLNTGEAGGSGLTTFNIGAGSSLTVFTVLTNATFSPATPGSLALIGNGTMTLKVASTYTGGTTISSGTLRANNTSSSSSATGSGDVMVSAGTSDYGGGRLGGSGFISGNVTLASSGTARQGGVIAAGPDDSTTGTLTTGNQTWNGGAAYYWKITAAGSPASANSGGSGTPGLSTTWDNLSMTGLTVDSGAPFTIDLNGNVTLSRANYSWIIAQSSSPVSGASENTNYANSSLFALDTTNFTVNGSSPSPISSLFSLEFVSNGGGDNLVLDYNAAPEPGAGLLILVGGSSMLLNRRRRKMDSMIADRV